MNDPAIITDRLDELRREWEEESLEPSLRKMPESQDEFTTVSLKPIERLYTPLDVEDIDFERDINFPGMAPYTRGIHPTGYRAKPWTMRQFAGYGSCVRHQPALQIPARTRTDGAFDRLRFADADGLRLRPPVLEGEVGKLAASRSRRAKTWKPSSTEFRSTG